MTRHADDANMLVEVAPKKKRRRRRKRRRMPWDPPDSATAVLLCLFLWSILLPPPACEAGLPQGNCGLSCYRWRKCKAKLSSLTGGHQVGG